MPSSIKPEIHNAARGEPSHGHRYHVQTKNLVKVGRVVPKVYDHRLTNTHTDTLVTIFRSPIGGGVKNNKIKFNYITFLKRICCFSCLYGLAEDAFLGDNKVTA